MKKDYDTAIALCCLGFIGLGGLHEFYLGNIGKGLIKFFTVNYFFIGTIVDLCDLSEAKKKAPANTNEGIDVITNVNLSYDEYHKMLIKTEQLQKENEMLQEHFDKVVEQRDQLIKEIEDYKKHEVINIEYIDTLDGIEFEKYMAKILEKTGYSNVKRTPDSNDYGIDVLAEKDGIKYAIQCKNYQSPVGNKCVQEAYSGKQYYNAHVGVVVTNNYFTNNAKELAKKNNIILWDRDALKKMIKTTNKN